MSSGHSVATIRNVLGSFGNFVDDCTSSLCGCFLFLLLVSGEKGRFLMGDIFSELTGRMSLGMLIRSGPELSIAFTVELGSTTLLILKGLYSMVASELELTSLSELSEGREL